MYDREEVVAVPFILYLVRFCSSKSCKPRGSSDEQIGYRTARYYLRCCNHHHSINVVDFPFIVSLYVSDLPNVTKSTRL